MVALSALGASLPKITIWRLCIQNFSMSGITKGTRSRQRNTCPNQIMQFGGSAIHTMFGSERLDLVPFMGTSALSFKGFPEGAHIARIYDFELQTSVSNCKDSPEVKEANYSTLKITWHSELRDEGYRVSFEALDVIKYSEDFSELEISHEYFSDSGIKGRDKLTYTLKGENLQIEGAINFYDDLINISINVPIMQREHTVVFGTNDKLVLSW